MERPLTRDIKASGEPLSIEEYEKAGGYQALRKALRMSPQEIQQLVIASNLNGRGGAGFPTGKKWSFVPMGKDARHPKYVIVNADEMEPGTFKDRMLLEANPHLIIEGTIIASYAVEADVSYIFLRWGYKLAEKRLTDAIAAACAKGYLGRNILGSSYDLEMHLHTSSGRYMCGEENGLLDALEGKRPIPRTKPPRGVTAGLWGKPTVVNNVETLANVPHIITNGAEWFRKLSYTQEGGTKLYGASGNVKRPGLWELPMGTTLREIFEEHAGGMENGFQFRGLLPGGASTYVLTKEHFDIRMDFGSVKKAGSGLGTGTMIVFDDKCCPVRMAHNLQTFYARESCGWCTPCREGLPWLVNTLEAIENGQGQYGDIELLEEHIWLLSSGHTFCALAPCAMEPLRGILKYFRKDFEKHVAEHRCPWRQ